MKKLYRSETDKRIGGICGGVGELLDVDPTIVRLVAIVLALATAVVPFLVGYLFAWWIVPTKAELAARQ
ncbi:MAG TPA: PspC domain-containing protein [Bacteroidota bacterium]|nr:PspC domain-containing protein [Bacteroidota bacterium]